MRKILMVTVLTALACACGSTSPSDADLNAWTREVRVLTPDQVAGRSFEELSGLEEKASIGIGGDEQAISDAKQQLKRRAAKLDADAVVIIACGRNVRPVESDPLPTHQPVVVCQGIAIRWTD